MKTKEFISGSGTRCAAFICSGEMAVAYWTSHGLHAFLPLLNKGEMAMLYCFLFLYIFARGPGRFSLDGLIRNKKQINPET